MAYITDLRLKCDAHISMFTEAAATVSALFLINPSFCKFVFKPIMSNILNFSKLFFP